jgi:hypothetical protein
MERNETKKEGQLSRILFFFHLLDAVIIAPSAQAIQGTTNSHQPNMVR